MMTSLDEELSVRVASSSLCVSCSRPTCSTRLTHCLSAIVCSCSNCITQTRFITLEHIFSAYNVNPRGIILFFTILVVRPNWFRVVAPKRPGEEAYFTCSECTRYMPITISTSFLHNYRLFYLASRTLTKHIHDLINFEVWHWRGSFYLLRMHPICP